MKETTEPTARTMPLVGGHPVLDLVNTVYGQVDGPVEHDVLADPADLVVFAGRCGLADPMVPADGPALRAARSLRGALDPLLRALLAGSPPPPSAAAVVESGFRSAYRAGRLVPRDGALGWQWPADDARAPVHRLAVAAVELLTDSTELDRLRCCAACRWLYLDHSRGRGRRWCSMAECGTDAKKRRYVQRRRLRRTP